MPAPEPFAARVRRLTAERGWTPEDVARRVPDGGLEGTSRSTFVQAMGDPRKLNRALIERTAAVLETEPSEFAEWRPIVVSDALQLDHDNLNQVLANLRAIERKPTADVLGGLPAAPKRRTAAARRAVEDASGQRIRDLGRQRLDRGKDPSDEEEGAAGDTGG